ncbi:hypothetical protein [Streptomyces nigrescens]
MSDPRARLLAEHRQRIAHEGTGIPPRWDNLSDQEQRLLLGEADEWLRAAVEAGLTPLAERPTDKHMAVYVDDEGFLYGEYPTVPVSDSLLRLVWASEMAVSKQESEYEGVEFRLIGWSQ